MNCWKGVPSICELDEIPTNHMADVNSDLRGAYAKISREVDSGIYEELIDDVEEDRNSFDDDSISQEWPPLSSKPTYQVVPPRLFRKDSIKKICRPTTLRSQYIVDELLKTEEDFLENMKFVEQNYIINLAKESIKQEEKEAMKMVFLNWDQLQIKAKKFIMEIEKCGYDYELIGELFLDSTDLIGEYCFYLTNQPVANTYMTIDGTLYLQSKKIQADIKDPLGLSNHLLIPMQRLTRYPLILESLLNSLENKENIQKLQAAIDMIKTVTDESNSFIAASSIANLPFTLKDQGKFIRKDTFDGIEGKHNQLWKNVEVFLFEKVLIFAAIQPHNNYMYKESIYFEHMAVQINEELILLDFVRNKLYDCDKYTFILKSKDSVMISKWRKIIENQLWLQMISIKENRTGSVASGAIHD